MSLHKTRGLKFSLVFFLVAEGFRLQAQPLSAPQTFDSTIRAPIVRSAVTYVPVSQASEDVIKQRATQMNRFAFELYQQLMQKRLDKNLIFSPLSVQGAFSLLYPATAEDQPANRELGATMHFAGPQSACHDAMKGYLLHLQRVFTGIHGAKRLEWQMVNNVWVDRRFGLQQTYLDTVKTYYNTGAGLLDLSSPLTREQSRLGINNYISGHTKSLIKDLLPAEALDDYSRVVLTNAVYMLANWEQPFAREATRKEAFHLSSMNRVSVEMMGQKGIFGFMENAEYTAISMPYVGRNLAILFVLPGQALSLNSLASSFSEEKLDLILGQLQMQRVAVNIPKFNFTWGSISLKEPFKRLGFRAMFDEAENPLPHLLTKNGAPLRGGVYIQDIYHKANIIIDEKGTEAAAATGVIIGYRSTNRPEEVKIFKMDRPAMFAIYDTKYHGVLFLGHVANPLTR